MERPQSVLFCCDHNAVRSPMAEGLMKKLYGTEVYVQSAGVRGDMEIDGFAIAVCEEIGVPLQRHRARSFDQMEDWGDDLGGFDLVVALSPASQRRVLDRTRMVHLDVEYWPVLDPTGLGEAREEKLRAYRETRDQIRARMIARFGRTLRGGRGVSLRVEALTGAAFDAALGDLARLRIAVFREWPYLYDGDATYEERYLASYRDAARAILVAARDGERIVGAATGMPLEDHADAAQIRGELGVAREAVFYCAESVLLPEFRGCGAGHAFFERREAHARALGRTHSAFLSVIRAEDHPDRPGDYRPLDGFWRRRGYAPVPGVESRFEWTDAGHAEPSVHRMGLWMRAL